MRPSVYLQILLGDECLTADVANVGLFTCVGPNMNLKVVFTRHRLAAEIADALTFPSVRLHMRHKNLFPGVTFVTDLALVGFWRRLVIRIVLALVDCQSVTVSVRKATNVALERFLTGVTMFMFLELRIRIETFLANVTLKFVLVQVALAVVDQVCPLYTRVATYVADVVLFAGVNLFVVF